MHQEIEITRWEGARACETLDSVVLEEPLEIRINGKSLAVTMRTPGDDFALAAGLLFAEGLITGGEEIKSISYCTDPGVQGNNILNVFLDESWDYEGVRWQRHFAATSSCGLCGKASIEAVQAGCSPLSRPQWRAPVSVIAGLGEQMRSAQRVFHKTGGLHAAGLFDCEGKLLSLKEDVGRHNAVDKVVGAEVLAERTPLDERILMVSGRTSFEIVQKAAMARVPVLCAVSAPSSLAVELAREMNMTLVGFLRGDTMNVYAGGERVGEK